MRTAVVAIAVLLLGGSMAAGEKPPRVPKTITSSASSAPHAWISESAAVDADRRLRASALDEAWISRLESRVNRPREQAHGDATLPPDAPCEKSVGRFLEQFGSTDSVRDLTVNANAIFSGRVEASDQGFLFGQPGTLFAISVSGAAKGEVAPADVVFLFYPFARMQLKQGLLCADPIGKPVVPRVGDVLVAFPFLPPVGDGERIFNLDPQRQLVVVRDGRAHVPANLTDELEETASAATILIDVRRDGS